MNTLSTILPASLIATLIAAAATTAAPPPPPPNAGLYALVGQIRGQIAEVELRAKFVLPHCDDAEDVRDELAQLCRDLDRFEQRLAVGIRHHNDLDRLARLAERVHEHTCELKEELADAIEDLHDDGRIQHFRSGQRFQKVDYRQQARRHPAVHYVGLDLDDLQDELEDRREERREAVEEYYDDLEDRFDDLDDDDFRRRRFVPRSPRTIYRYPQPRYYQPWGWQRHVYQPRVYQQRGVRVTVGRFGPRLSFSSGGAQVAPKVVLPPPPVVQPVQPVPIQPAVGLSWQQVHELKVCVGRLHALTLQLQRVLCG